MTGVHYSFISFGPSPINIVAVSYLKIYPNMFITLVSIVSLLCKSSSFSSGEQRESWIILLQYIFIFYEMCKYYAKFALTAQERCITRSRCTVIKYNCSSIIF